MNTHNIPQKDYLDILFEHRNKDYGAYALRRAYDRRMTLAVGITFGIGLLLALSSFAFREETTNPGIEYHWVELPEDITLPEKEKPVEAEKPKQEVRQQVKTEDFTTIRIEKDDQVKATDLPPVMDSLTTAVIGTEKKQGEADSGFVHITTQKGDGSGMGPEGEKEPEIFIKAEIDAEFPGGTSAWFRYVSRAIERNMDDLQEDGRSGTVVVLFVVDKEGRVSDVRALGCGETRVANCLGPDSELAKVAVEAVRKGPDWKPAMQNGRLVKAYRRQPVTFRLEAE